MRAIGAVCKVWPVQQVIEDGFDGTFLIREIVVKAATTAQGT